MLSAGTYTGPLVLERPLTLTAEDGPGSVRLHVPSGPALVVLDGAVTVSALSMRSSGEEPAVAVSGGRLDLIECTVEATAWTACHVGEGRLSLRDCEVTNDSGAGVVVTSPEGATLESSRLHGIGSSALVATGDGVLAVRGCSVGPCGGNGVFVSGAAVATISGSTLEATAKPALAIEQGGGLTATNTVVRDAAGVGVYLAGSGAVTLDDCSVEGSAAEGIYVDAGCAPVRMSAARRGGSGGRATQSAPH
jgi:nitrous oxidase accessory protein NosD